MKKILITLLVFVGLVGLVYADDTLTLEQFFNAYFGVVTQTQNLPQSYKYIQLKFKNVYQDTKLYTNLQKAVYLDLLPNAAIQLPLTQKISQEQAANIIEKNFDVDILADAKQKVTLERLRNILLSIKNQQAKESIQQNIQQNTSKSTPNVNPITSSEILNDVYEKLTTSYINANNFDIKKSMYGTVQGLVNSLKDEYTVFFPPTEAKDFNDELTAEYEGIGAYIEMIKPGELIIVSPISGSPAEKIGLKAGDRIIEINGNKIGESTDVQTVTSRIKGPEGSQVTIKILRDKKEFAFKVKRERITIKNVELKQLSGNICDVSIRMFGLGTANEFASIITQSQDKKCKKYIFDLRNNPGGSLDDVASILSYFVPDNKPVVIIKSTTENTIIHASPNTIKITDKPIMILINKGSASASEIFAGTIKEYGKKVTLLGEKSFGKGSVQQLVEYSDGSILKYTIAKRYTGKLQKNIDKNGIDPDIKITDNPETKADEILEYAKKKLLSNQ